MYADMHMHTWYSDGTSTPQQVVSDCAFRGLELIAVSDHDTMRGYKEAVSEAKRWGVTVVPAVEVSTPDYHILGYGVDPNHTGFQEFLEHSQELQYKNAQQRVEKVRASGVPLTMEKIRAHFPESRIGKMNIVYTMMLDPECRTYLKGMPFQQVRDTYVRKGGIASGIDAQDVSVDEAISAIHDAGGAAVIAHAPKDIDSIADLERLVAQGIDGVEIQPNFGCEYDEVRAFAQARGLPVTFGSDYHGLFLPERMFLGRNGNQLDTWW